MRSLSTSRETLSGSSGRVSTYLIGLPQPVIAVGKLLCKRAYVHNVSPRPDQLRQRNVTRVVAYWGFL